CFQKFGQNPNEFANQGKSCRVLVKPARFDWDDVGSWTAVSKYLEQLPGNNTANCAVTIEGSANNIIFTDSGTHVALLGVNDVVVVQTKDAILVCHRDEVEKIKGLIP